LGNAWLDNWFFGFGGIKKGLTWLGLDSSGLAMAQLGRARISLAMVPIVFRVIDMTGAQLGLAWRTTNTGIIRPGRGVLEYL
jgi:hypothetical protein